MKPITITKRNFRARVIKSKQPVLIDFWAKWCGPCRLVSPIIDEIARETNNILVAKVDIDEQPELAQAFEIMSIPTLAVFKNGKIVQSTIGVRPKEEILKMLEL